MDYWWILSCILSFVVGYLSVENYKLRKYKKLWIDHARNTAQAQIDLVNQIQFGKPKIKDINL